VFIMENKELTEKPPEAAPPEACTPEAAKPELPPRPRSARVARMASAQSRISDETGRAPEAKLEAPPPPPPRERPRAEPPRLRDLDMDIAQELEEAFGTVSEQELYGRPSEEKRKPSLPGTPPEGKKGKVFAVRGNDVFLDVPGGRSQGVLSLEQFPEGPPAVGSEVDIHIEGYDRDNGLLLLSRKGAAVRADWSSVAEGMIVEARVTEANKGGLAVDVNSIRGFMPISQIDLYRVENTDQFVNQRLRCVVVEVNPHERNLVVSRRALLEKEREEAREKLWQELAEGQIREGVVRSVKDFGAFVDLGGVDGLLHVSEMSWERSRKATELVELGQRVKVVVLGVDRDTRRVSLGAKQLTASPWDNVDANYPLSSVVKGKVTRLMEFGAFVELEPGIEGLVHISELAPHRVRRANEVVQPGQEVSVMVLGIDREQRRISLSLKAAAPSESEEPEEEAEETPAEVKPTRPRTTPLRGGTGEGLGDLFTKR
jgi:small subunit ribosomal protein S1